jgi:putative MFS transporter
MQTKVKLRTALRAFGFWGGAISVTLGVCFHFPMFIASASMNYQMAGMSMSPLMVIGMALILAGIVSSGIALLPLGHTAPAGAKEEVISIAEVDHDPQLTLVHFQVASALAIILVIDMLKPATLGFVIPGSAREYHLTRHIVALLPFFALMGTTIGSLLGGVLADFAGRRSAILWAAIMFIGTSICGAMPSFQWNLAMCFMMGLAAGGMLPIAYTLLTEILPTRQRGLFLVALGGIGLGGGYLLAATSAAILEPRFGWRVMWFLGLPTGVLLILLNKLIPESPQFLIRQGRSVEANQIITRFSGPVTAKAKPEVNLLGSAKYHREKSPAFPRFRSRTVILALTATVWGMVNYGLLLWLPADLRSAGFSIASSDALLAQSAVIAFPTAAGAAWLYNAWSTKWTLILSCILTSVGLEGLFALQLHYLPSEGWVIVATSILMVGNTAAFATILPYSAELYPIHIRARATGFVAATGKSGGVIVQLLTMLSIVPALTMATSLLSFLTIMSAAMIWKNGTETRQRNLQEVSIASLGLRRDFE